MRYNVYLLCILLTLVSANAQQMQSPFLPGQTWKCLQGNDGGLTHGTSLKHSWDFSDSPHPNDIGKPLIAGISGTVVFAGLTGTLDHDYYGGKNTDCTQGSGTGFGFNVKILGTDGNHWRAAHYNYERVNGINYAYIFVKEGEQIKRGQVIGFVGNTGYSCGDHIHVHMEGSTDGTSISSPFADIGNIDGNPAPAGNPGDGIPTEGTSQDPHWYTSGNIKLFYDVYIAAGGSNAFGYTLTETTFDWYDSWTNADYANVYKTPDWMWPTNQSTNGALQRPYIIYDAMRGARSPVIIHGQIADLWVTINNPGNGPNSYLGAPIGDEYTWESVTRQDCQGGYITWNSTTATDHTYPETYSPGAFNYSASSGEPELLLRELPGSNNIGWSPIVSYLFVECYKRNGGAVTLGHPYAGAVQGSPAAVYEWDFTNADNESDFHWVQNFEDGSYGECIIMYNPDNEPPDNSLSTYWKNEAYLISHEIWTYYRNNDGITDLGFPVSDAYPIGTYLDRQDFQYGYVIRSTMSSPAEINVYEYGDFQIAATVNSPYVKVQSNPPGAALWEDTEYKGTSPQTLYIPEGESMDLTFKLIGYEDEDFSVDWANGGQTVIVNMVFSGYGSGSLDYMAIVPGYLDFSLTGTKRTVYVSKETSTGNINWQATPTQSWITVSPSSGNGNDSVTVTIDRTGLSGYYEESISFGSTAGSINLPVVLDAFSSWPGETTFTFADESALDDWLLVEGTADSSGVSNGQLKLVNGGVNTTRNLTECLLTKAGSMFSSVSGTFTLDNGPQGSNNQVTLVYVNYQDENHYYRWLIEENVSSGTVKLQKIYLDGQGMQQSQTLWQETMVLPNGTYTFTYANDTLTFKDEPNGSTIDATVVDNSYTSGRIGFAVNEETTLIDNVTIDGTTLVTYRNSTFVQDQYTLGKWDMAGSLSSTAKRTNSVTSNTLTETGVTSDAGLNWEADKAYGLTRGSSCLITDLDTELDGLQKLTIEGWFQFDNAYNNVIFGRWDSDKSYIQLEWNSDNGPLYAYVAESTSDPGSNYGYTANIEREYDRWYYIALVFDGTGSTDADKLKLYIDGEPVSLTYGPGSLPSSLSSVGSSLPLVLGYRKASPSGSTLGGLIGPIRVSNRARSASEIAGVMDNQIGFSVMPSSLALSPASSIDTLMISSNGATSISKVQDWLSLGTSSVQGFNQLVVVVVDSTGLSDGTYLDTLTVTGDDSTVLIPVSFTVSSPGSGPFDSDVNTLGLWNMTGTVGTDGKRINEITSLLLTEVSVSSTAGLNDETDAAYALTRGSSRLTTDLDTELDGLAECTIEGWFKFDNSLNNVMFGRWNSGGSSLILEWHADPGAIYCYVASSTSDGGSNYGYTGNISRSSDWHYLVMVFDGSQTGNSNRLKIYLDGDAVSLNFSGTIPSALTTCGSSHPLVLGNYKNASSGSSMGGSIAPVRVSDVARTSQEISDNYSSGLSKMAHDSDLSGESVIPDRFQLHQAYPNPFNPMTTIPYDLPQDAQVTIKIYNILGQQVKVLIDEAQKAGQRSVIWNGRDEYGNMVASGIYLYRMTTAGYVETRKMIMLK